MTQKDLAPRKFSGPKKKIRKGLLVVFTGNGKGKTTAAFGVAFRSLGRGLCVAVVQFIKGRWVSGEVRALERFGSRVTYHAEGEGFTWETQNLAKDRALAERGWAVCRKLLRENRHHVYLFDELLYVLAYKFLALKDVVSVLKKRPPHAHIIVTGRNAPPKLIQMADLVTEMKELKHPYKSGILAQPGVDY